jgi:hypothetical protein
VHLRAVEIDSAFGQIERVQHASEYMFERRLQLPTRRAPDLADRVGSCE